MDQPGDSKHDGGIMKKLIGFLDSTMRGGVILSTAVMTIACSLQVLSRYVLPHPFSWTEEIARFAFIYWSFLGAAYVVRLNGHLGMDALVNLLPKRSRAWNQRAVFIITLAFMVVVTVEGVRITFSQIGQEGIMVPISMAWIYAVVPFTGFVMSLYLIYLIFYWTEPERESACEWLPGEDRK